MNKRQSIILVVMAIGIFLCMLDTTVMNIALPAIQTGLHTDLNTLQWALNCYTITFASLTIPLGRLADQLGRNKIYISGLIIFLIGSLISAYSTTVFILISGRELQSVGAAIVFPASMTIGIDTVDLNSRSKAVLILGITQGLAAACGPIVGGFLTQVWGWQSIFFANVPLVLLAIIMCAVLLPLKNENIIQTKIDIVGMNLTIVMLFSLTLALVKGNDWGWFSNIIIGLIVIFFISLFLFIWQESAFKNPMVRLDLFKYRQFTGSSVVTVIAGIFFVGMLVLMPSFFTKVQGHSELESALMITPATVMVFILSPISGLLLKRMGSRLLIFIGILFLGLGYIGLSIMNPNVYWNFAVSSMLIGSGYGIIIGPITILSSGNFTGELLTSSQSVIGVFRQIGTVLAVAIFVSTLSTNLESAKNQIWSTAQTEVKKLTVSQSYKNKILEETHNQIFKEEKSSMSNEPAIDEKTEAKITKKEINNYLKNSDEVNLPNSAKVEVKREISKEVSNNVKEINSEVYSYQKSISRESKEKLTNAFINPYKFATLFVWLALSTIFIFPKSKIKKHPQQ